MSPMHAYYIISLWSRWFYVLYLCIHSPGSHCEYVTPAYVAIGGSVAHQIGENCTLGVLLSHGVVVVPGIATVQAQ